LAAAAAYSIGVSQPSDVLGLWLEQNEAVKFWLRVMIELRDRGTEDIFRRGHFGFLILPPHREYVYGHTSWSLCSDTSKKC